MKESALFFLKFLRSRGKIGSIVPSSRFLTCTMMKMIPFDRVNTLLELGAGTGALTKELIKKRKPGTTLIVFEPDEEFAGILAKKFAHEPNLFLVKEKADQLLATLEKHHFPKPDCIVSSLPFATFRRDKSSKIFAEIRHSLSPTGLFVLYQYTQITLALLLKNFKIQGFSFVPLNLPPALVFQCVPLKRD